MFRDLQSDAGHAIRIMVKRPGFTALIVLTLAVGIGASTAVFATINAALLRALPYEDPGRLVMGRATFHGNVNPYASAYDYYDYRERSDAFESLAATAWMAQRATITGGVEPETAEGIYVSWDLFSTIGVTPQLGRHFVADEGTAEGAAVVLLSHSYWQRRFGGSPEALGQTLTINARPHTIVGVMPAGFHFLYQVDFWRPMWPDGPYAGARRWHNWLLVGRLKPGVTLREAQSQVDVISAQLAQEYPDTNLTKALRLDPLQSVLVEDHRPGLLLLMGAATFVLLIACGNVAGLLLARGSTRRTELAVRSALGASRGRLVVQLMTESTLIALLSGALGLLLAKGLLRLLPSITRLHALGITALEIDIPLALFTLGVSILTALIFGTVPALRSARFDVAQSLKSGSRSTSPWGGTNLRSVLVTAQVSLSLMLLVSSGLLIRSFANLRGTDPGFDSRNLLTAEVSLPYSEYAEAEREIGFFEGLLEELRAIPGVSAAGMVSQLPLRDPGNNIYVWAAENPPADRSEQQVAYTRVVFPGYFETMRLPVIAGRGIEPTDTADSNPVLVINRTMARTLFPEQNPLGKQVVVDMGKEVTFEVIGIVGDARLTWIGAEPRLAMYHSYYQFPRRTMRMAIRTEVEAASVVSAVRQAVWRRDRNIPVENLVSMETLIADSVASQRVVAATLSAFSTVALLLAALGLYSLLAYYVGRRTHEIGIRMALGAGESNVVGLILGRGLIMVGIGLAAGLAGSFGAAVLIRGMLYGVGTIDPITYTATSLVFGIVALAACLLPAWRAARVDPVIALRAE